MLFIHTNMHTKSFTCHINVIFSWFCPHLKHPQASCPVKAAVMFRTLLFFTHYPSLPSPVLLSLMLRTKHILGHSSCEKEGCHIACAYTAHQACSQSVHEDVRETSDWMESHSYHSLYWERMVYLLQARSKKTCTSLTDVISFIAPYFMPVNDSISSPARIICISFPRSSKCHLLPGGIANVQAILQPG